MERSFIDGVEDGESRRQGVAESRGWRWPVGLAQVGGAVGHRGGVDGWPSLGYALISPEDGIAKDGGGDYCGSAGPV